MLVLFSVLALLVHPYSLIYLLTGALYLISKANTIRAAASNLVVFLPSILVFIVWLTIGLATNKAMLLTIQLAGSVSSDTKPYMQADLNKITPSSTNSMISEGVLNRFYNLGGLFISNPKPGPGRSFSFPRLTLIAALGTSLFIFIIFGLYKNWYLIEKEVLYLIIGLIGINFMANGYYIGLGSHWYLIALIPMLIGFGVDWLSGISKLLSLTLFVATVCESIYVSYWIYKFDIYKNLDWLWNSDHSLVTVLVAFFSLWYLSLILLFIKELSSRNTDD